MKKLIQQPKTLFLIDGLGALVTGISLLLMSAPLNEYVGMPPSVLHPLAWIAGVFAAYSLSCFAGFGPRWPLLMSLIGSANLLYRVATAMLVFQHSEQLTLLGIAYFVGEILIICTLVAIEFTAVRTRVKS